jgi:hypothetical protein
MNLIVVDGESINLVAKKIVSFIATSTPWTIRVTRDSDSAILFERIDAVDAQLLFRRHAVICDGTATFAISGAVDRATVCYYRYANPDATT